MDFPLIESIINDKYIEHEDWELAAKEYLSLREELKMLQTLVGFKAVLNARERLQYLRKVSQDFQYTDFGKLLVRELWENDFSLDILKNTCDTI